jgi:hypothetical protein
MTCRGKRKTKIGPLFSGYRGSSWDVKRLGREVNLSSPSSTDVGEYRYISTPPMCLPGVAMDKFSFLTWGTGA